uniref:Putative LAGLIDADG homing endonuclease n=1 Tax=Rhexinema sarcinoideum TaxID=43261 RepID=A0A1B2RYX1_9CHLO|nr:putative LAGLIDADG homing endonuclease [Rhexinema sarcinoideum]
MSNTSPISLRIASKTRCFETSGDSSYYYSNQLLSNLAFLKIASILGQQLSWPSTPPALTPSFKQGSTFLAKASLKHSNLRLEPHINLKATPGNEWLSANFKLVEKLTKSQQFFHCKALGLLAKTLGRCGRFNSVYQYNGALQKLPFYTYKGSSVFSINAQSSEIKVKCKLQSGFTSKDQKSFFSHFASFAWGPLGLVPFGCPQTLQSNKQSNPVALALSQNKAKVWSKKLEKNNPPSLNFLLPLSKFDFAAKKKSSFTFNAKAKPRVALFKGAAVRKSQGTYQSKQKFLSLSSDKAKAKAVSDFSLFFSATARRKSLLPSFSVLQAKKACQNFANWSQPRSSTFGFLLASRFPQRGKDQRSPYWFYPFGCFKSLQSKPPLKTKTKCISAFKTSTGLPFYLGSLGLISHCQVLKSSLAVVPIVSGSLKSNLLLADHSQVIKTTSSSGLGAVSASPQLFIARNHKHCTQYLFFKIPFQFASCFASKQRYKKFKKKILANTVYLTGKLQGLRQKLPKRAKPFYASARWL